MGEVFNGIKQPLHEDYGFYCHGGGAYNSIYLKEAFKGLSFLLKDYVYELPCELIAQFPLEKRDASRLMVADRKTGRLKDSRFSDLGRYLEPGDLLILNDTKVFPARLIGRREGGGRIEALLLNSINGGAQWKCLVKGAKKLKKGGRLLLEDRLEGSLEEKCEDGACIIKFCSDEPLMDIVESIGKTPLPPYIKRGDKATGFNDKERYQTVYAKRRGAVAAPTAGLHFTRETLDSLATGGIDIEYLTLHVGWGTFRPVRVKDIREHKLHSERYAIPLHLADKIKKVKSKGGRVVSVGTTATRALEAAFGSMDAPVLEGSTELFIMPGYGFKIVDVLITNFHLPGSTLLMLVSAFGGREFILNAYREAVKKGYRFYSYGDAMLIL